MNSTHTVLPPGRSVLIDEQVVTLVYRLFVVMLITLENGIWAYYLLSLANYGGLLSVLIVTQV